MTIDVEYLNSRMSCVRVAENDGIVTLTLSRPDRLNALGPDMLPEILGVLEVVRASREVKALVMTGEGRAFCAGVDLRTPFFMENVESDSVFEGMRLLDWQHELIVGIHELPQPTIAVVNGDAVGGGGFGMAMACDMRFAVNSARFWMIPGQVNVVQDFGLTWLLQRCIGTPRTMELVFSGRRVDGREAAQMGIVNETFDDVGQMHDHARTITDSIARMGSDAGRTLKMIVRHGASSPLRDQLRVEAVANGLCFNSTEFKQAKTELLNRINKR
ncbi:enoyl-CoA hydratase/isomerase family protein [Intrasporangium calvum]|uniref:Enoyl-CoA hydratase/isomerase n=1 Tax=Intrasporangium calvum (strain ATCC 23552 / DSM 43043 / JCM 3097 / NBRC 12989 / NCIMB 10167 / NRRL B-3866 / 7 KIP) TaxID=710696 RepID=E6SCL5_INTC7|nr:enoyl-CoA hydratase/isomerase family protein [Intrasporangium calvum]ADU49619.1 Enoyl-CoA hydratase/isomerase [Intrasporangium calvum DSM 43043]